MTRHSLAPMFLLAAVLTACGDDVSGADDGGTVTVALDLTPAEDRGFDIDRVTADFVHDESGESVSEVFDIRGTQASAEVELRPGSWSFLVTLFEDDEQVGSGQGRFTVFDGFVTQVNVAIDLPTGGVRMTVDWAEDFHGVIADISERPVEVQIEGAGTYHARGLSRIGWDIDVIETPTEDGRTHKEAGLLAYTRVAILGLEAESQSQALALAALINGPAGARDVLVSLQGFGGERAVVLLAGAEVLDGDARLTENGLVVGGLVLGVDRIELTDHHVLGLIPVCPAPGQSLEIEGVTIEPCYAPNVLRVPEPETSDPLRLPAVRDGETLYDWASGFRDDVEEEGCIGCGSAFRKSMSVITRDGDRVEIDRINIFENWVSRFTFFDPEARYGRDYLFSLEIVNDKVEEAGYAPPFLR
jgi:hypothetical protein